MTDKYIDPSASVNGSGTYASPYNSFAELNAITGNRSNERWLVKRGTSIRSGIAIPDASDAYNFSIDCYGDALDRPLIIGSDIYTAGWTLYSGNTWVSATLATERSWFADNVQLIRATSLAAISAFQSWYVGSKAYVDLGGVNPNSVVMEYTSRSYGVITASRNCSISRLWVKNTNNSAFVCQSGTVANPVGMLLVADNKAEYPGAWSPSAPGSCFSIYGADKVSPASAMVISNIGNHAQNNFVEFWSLTNTKILGNVGTGNNNSFEAWGYDTTIEIAYNESRDIAPVGNSIGHNAGLWVTSAAESSPATGNDSAVNFHHNLITFAGTGLNAGVGCHIQSGASHKIENNTFYRCKSGIYTQTGDTTSFTFKNNIVYAMPWNEINAAGGNTLMMNDTLATATGTYDNNCYYRTDRTASQNSNFSRVGATYDNFTGWKGDGRDANAIYADPLFTNIAAGDFTLQTGSTCQNVGASSLGYTRGIEGNPVFDPPDMGAYEHQFGTKAITSGGL